MKEKTKYTIHGHEGEWIISNSWISELGYIMIRFYNLEKKVWMNVHSGTTIEQALNLPWVNKQDSDETNPPNLDIIY